MAASPEAWRAAGAALPWHGHRVFFRVAGAGPALLLLHGFPTSSWDWRHVWDALAAGHQVIALDYLGFGFSDKPADGPYSVFAYADQAEAVLAHLGVGAVHVLAHDLGDTVAQELLARDRERRAAPARGLVIRSACLLNGGLFPETHRPRPIQRLLASPLGPLVARLSDRARFARGLAAVFGPDTQPSAEELDGFWACASHAGGVRLAHRTIRYMAERRQHRARWVGALTDGAVPLAAINGSLDPVSGRHMITRLREVSPAVAVHELPTIGHYPQTEAPADVLAAYAAFRLGVDGGAAATAPPRG